MKRYLVDRNERLNSTTLLLSLRPRKERDRLHFEAGQYAAVAFRRHGRPTPMRCLSMVSAPDTPELLQFGIQIEGAFTSAAAELERGDSVVVDGPFGEFGIDERIDREVVMLAGGIGITPFMSMIRSAAAQQFSIPMDLLYSYRGNGPVPFQAELKRYAKDHERFRLGIFNTGSEPTATTASGRITEAHLQRVIKTRHAVQTFFICGSPGFTATMIGHLEKLGVHETRIITEVFTQGKTYQGELLAGRFSPRKLTYSLAALTLVVGSIGIMGLDLDRNLPALVNAASSTTTTSNPTTPITTTVTPTTSGSTSTPSTSTPSTSSSTNMPTQTYQTPVTSVS